MKSMMIDKINNKYWLACGEITKLQAAFLLAQIDINRLHVTNKYHLTTYIHPDAKKFLDIIETWRIGINEIYTASPFYYINRAIKDGLLDMSGELLVEVSVLYKNFLDDDRLNFIKNYPYIEREINIINQVATHENTSKTEAISEENISGLVNEKSQVNELVCTEFDETNKSQEIIVEDCVPVWIVEARRLADEIGLRRWNRGIRQITARNICDNVASELEKHEKYWGTKGPFTSDTVRKEALKGWRFKFPYAENKKM